MDDPVRFTSRFVNYNRTIASADSKIRAVVMQLHKIPNDQLFCVSESDNELVYPIEGVMLHNVPKNRLAADLYHCFRTRVRFFGEPGSHSPRQNRDFHSACQPSSCL